MSFKEPMGESKMDFTRIARRALVELAFKGEPPRLEKGILAARYNPAAPGAAPRFRPPVLSLFRSEIA